MRTQERSRLPRARLQRAPTRFRPGRSDGSVLVTTLGMLGAVGLQASALRNNQGSYERTQTSILTQGIFDAMRANLTGVGSGAYNTSGWVCTSTAGAGLAGSDLRRWIDNLQQQIHADACGSIESVPRWPHGRCVGTTRATGGGGAQIVRRGRSCERFPQSFTQPHDRQLPSAAAAPRRSAATSAWSN